MPHRILQVVSFLSGCRPFQGLPSGNGYHDLRHEWADFPQRLRADSQVPVLREGQEGGGVFKGLGWFLSLFNHMGRAKGIKGIVWTFHIDHGCRFHVDIHHRRIW